MKLNKKSIICINAIIIFIVLLFDGLYYGLKFSSMESDDRIWFKCVASVMFVLLLGVNFLIGIFKTKDRNIKFPLLMLYGVILACAGDIALYWNFIIGASLFGLGHVFFISAFFVLSKFKLKDLIPMGIGVLISVLVVALYPKFDFEGMDVVIYIYAVVVSAMLGKAISVMFNKEVNFYNRLFICLGGTLFFLSDLMLVFCQFADAGEVFDALCLIFYYPAECFFGLSVLAYYLKGDFKNLINDNK